MASSSSNLRHPSVQASLALALLVLACAACGGSDGGSAAATAPTVTATAPLDAAANVPAAITLSALFDRAMAPLTSTTFLLKQGATNVAGAVSMSADAMTATFTPSSSLAAGSTFTATIPAGTRSAAGASLAADQVWSFTTEQNPATRAPLLVSTSPADGATAAPTNSKISATFNTEMAPLSASTFTLSQGGSSVSGSVSSSPDGRSAIFTPSGALAPSLPFTATITAAAASAAGTHLAAAQSFNFTTGAGADTTQPAVTATLPRANDTGVATNAKVIATFSKAMDPQTLTSSSFTVKQAGTQVPGTVSYGPGTTATFTASNPLPSSALITVGLTSDVKDLQGNALGAAYAFSFTTGSAAARGPAPVGLGTAGNYAILAKAAISTVPSSAITGDIAVSPAAQSYLTGFSLVNDSTNVFARSTQITGKAFAADSAVPTPSNLTTAVGNMQSAYTDAAGRPTPDFLELGTGNIGGKTLAPGLYKWTSTVSAPLDVVISGGANDVWIFQTTGDLNVSAGKRFTLSGGAQAKNIFWQVAGQATFGAGAHFEGILLCKTQVTLGTGATMNGRVLAQTQVALEKATLSQPTP